MANFTPKWKCVAAEFGEGENKGLVALWMKMDTPSISKADADLVDAAQSMYALLKSMETADGDPMSQYDPRRKVLADILAKVEGREVEA